MASGKEIRRRIKSVKNTGKITRAMEMVAASKMRRAMAAVLAVRPYAHAARGVLANLTRAFEGYESGFLEIREVKNILAIIVTSNRGLCGSFNSQLIKKIKEQMENPEKLKINRAGNKKIEARIKNNELRIDFITIGKKGENAVRRMGRPARNATHASASSHSVARPHDLHSVSGAAGGEIIASFPDLTYLPSIEDIRPLAKIIIGEYLAKKYDKVVIFYTDYVSAIFQHPKVRQLLPISRMDIEKQIAEMDILAKDYGLDEKKADYKVEPNPREVLEYIFPRLIEMQIYHAVAESNASKESARMMAMRNATEAAEDMSDDLAFAYNQIRQMKITQEIAEISAGRAALE